MLHKYRYNKLKFNVTSCDNDYQINKRGIIVPYELFSQNNLKYSNLIHSCGELSRGELSRGEY